MYRDFAERTPPELRPSSVIGSAVILRSRILEQGMNSDEVQLKRRRREWVSLRPGVYLETGVLAGLDPVQRHLILIDATMPKLGADAVLSHLSAACLHGISLWQPSLRAVQVTRPGAASGHRRRSLHTLRAPIGGDEIVELRGYRVTNLARTITDLSRTLPFEEAIVAADAALHSGLITVDELIRAARRAPQRSGMRGAHQVISFADRRSESPGESRSRVLFHRAGLPAPTPQLPICDASGEVIARSDFGWEEHQTVGEFDGAQKYGRLLRPGEKAGDVIFREKLREDAIRDLGWIMVRWTWSELNDVPALSNKIARALDRGRRIQE